VQEAALAVGTGGVGLGARAASRAATHCCFVAGTLVDTETGLRAIEAIAVGDRVWARDVETGETALKPVTDLIRRHERVIWEVALAGPDGASERFETTDDHPWWIVGVDGSGRWVTTDDLNPGMVAVSRDAAGPDGRMVIASIAETDRTDATYNLTVADFHTYFVGEERVLVHNCGTKPPSHTPAGAGRGGAFNQAKRDNNIPTSQQPDNTGRNVDRQGNTQPGRQYTYTNNKGETVTIRDDAAGHRYADDPSQNRGAHFNDDQGRHYDYEDPQ
jgi:hypothetical protein